MGGDQVDEPGPPGLHLVLLDGDKEEPRQGHRFPGHQEKKAVAGRHHQGQAPGQQAVEEAQAAARCRLAGLGPVAEAVERPQCRDQKEGKQKTGRDPVEGQGKSAPGNGPLQVDGRRRGRRQGRHRCRRSEDRAEKDQDRRHPLPGGRPSAGEEPGKTRKEEQSRCGQKSGHHHAHPLP